jgi:protein-glutamine gamma-glutamyltransferase
VISVSGMSAIDPAIFWGLERTIFMRKHNSPVVFNYESLPQLRFEMMLRAKTVEAAFDLARSGVVFAVFEKSRCNPWFWNLNEKGGFELRRGIRPSDAIRDIFVSGHMYAFECATAIVIVLYKAVLDSIGEYRFDRYFADLLLYAWYYDKDLRLITKDPAPDSYPGDVLYFENPDVNPLTPEWQGENVVKIDDHLFFGHGIGVTGAHGIIAGLNRHRVPWSTRSAFLTDQVTYPDYKYIHRLSESGIDSIRPFDSDFLVANIGSSPYVKALPS